MRSLLAVAAVLPLLVACSEDATTAAGDGGSGGGGGATTESGPGPVSVATSTGIGSGVTTGGASPSDGTAIVLAPAVAHVVGLTRTAAGDLLATGTLEYTGFVARVAVDGELRWSSMFAPPAQGGIHDVAPLGDDGVIVVGQIVGEQSSVGSEPFLARIAANGEVLWARMLVIEGNEGGWVATAILPEGADFVVELSGHGHVRIDEDGTILSTQRPATPAFGVAPPLRAPDGSTLLRGARQDASGRWRTYLARLEPDGALAWQRWLDAGDLSIGFSSFDRDGGLLLRGGTFPPSVGVVGRMSASGELLWTRRLAASSRVDAVGIVEDAAGGLVVGGTLSRDGGVGAELFQTRLSADGEPGETLVFDDDTWFTSVYGVQMLGEQLVLFGGTAEGALIFLPDAEGQVGGCAPPYRNGARIIDVDDGEVTIEHADEDVDALFVEGDAIEAVDVDVLVPADLAGHQLCVGSP